MTRFSRSPAGAGLRGLLFPTGVGEGLVAAAAPVPVREVWRRFWPYARPYRRMIAACVALVAVLPAIEAATIWMFKLLIDEVLIPHDLGAFWWIALLYLGLALLAGVASFADNYLFAWVGERFLVELRSRLFAHVQRLSLDFFERQRTGDMLSRLTGDVSSIERFVPSGMVDGLSYVFRIVFFAGALFYLRWDMALVSLALAALLWVPAKRFAWRIRQASREERRRSGSISAAAEESVSNIMLIQAYNLERPETERFERENWSRFAAELRRTRVKALYEPLVDLLEVLGGLAVVAIGTWEITRGRLSVGGLVAFLSYMMLMYSPVRGLGRLTSSIYSASAAAERVIEYFDARPSVEDRPAAVALGGARGLVEFEAVSFTYPGAQRPALSDVSFRAAPGETIALVGASGAGKSTIAKLLLRFYDPQAGVVRLDGHDLQDLELRSLREAVALLLQETLVLNRSVRENIGYGRPQASEAQIVAAARAADAHEFIKGLPDGYDTVVGERGRRLSGGQAQRVAIARAMIRNAPVLVLDEPTTGLDADSAQRILAPLRRLLAGRTSIIISHNLSTVQEATTILVLERGRIVERGTHPELLAAGGLYARLYELHQPDAPRPRPALAL